MSVAVRLTIAALVAGWTITLGLWPSGDSAGGFEDGRSSGLHGFWPCGAIRDFDGSRYLASEIEAAGLGCRDARRLVRRVHEACRLESCDLEGYECAVDQETPQAVSCARGPVPRVRWSWVGT